MGFVNDSYSSCIFILLSQGWRTFLSGGSKLRSQTEKTWVTDVIILTRGLNGSSAKICAKSKKIDLHPRNIQLPVFNAPVWKNKLFFTTLFSLPFFRKIFQTTSGSLKCASGSLSDPRVSGSPFLSYHEKAIKAL